ncbi:MAG: 2-oxoglutarate dehydrogenase complex dihydrolipoyllysine-residue succinyltransferase [Planctomycetota bacterium]
MPEQDVVVPEVAESVAEVTILNWHKGVGEFVEADEALAEVETDKANVDMPAPFAGVITAHVAAVGDTLAIGEVVARIDTDKTEGTAAPAESKAGAEQPAEAASSSGTSDDKLADLSPAVRRIVNDGDLDVSAITATGPNGRLTKEDVLTFVDQQKSAKPATPPPAAKEAPKPAAATAATPAPAGVSSVGAGGQTTRRVAMSKIRRSIARNLLAAQQNAAILTTFNEVDLTEVMALRKKYKEPFGDKHGVGLGFMSFFSKAAAVALAEFERVNARIDGDDIVYHDYVNLGVAVSTERGLVVPVIKDVQAMSFATVEKEIKRVALAARDGKIGLAEMSGGTFTITNGGVFGSLLSTPIINAPQSGILGMHTIQQRPMAVDGEVKIRPMMYVALSYDHRIVDGKESVSFLVRLKQLLEDPARLLLAV